MRLVYRKFSWFLLVLLLVILPLVVGCAKYNTYYNAKKSFDQAEASREDLIKLHKDPGKPTGTQKNQYDLAIRKAQKVLDEYPGHSLTDDVLFLQAKSYHRLQSYRMAIRKLDLLFVNYPASDYLEEAYYIQGLNYLLLGAAGSSQEYLDKLARLFPDSQFNAQTSLVVGDNSFSLEEWEQAAGSYNSYLETSDDLEEMERVRLKVSECYWELNDYRRAADILEIPEYEFLSTDLSYQTRVKQAHIYVRLLDFARAKELLSGLQGEAEIQGNQGELAVIEAESLIAQGKPDEAAPLLEGMPPEWKKGDVKFRVPDMLAYLHLERGDWTEAQKQINEAIKGKRVLEDYSGSLQLRNNLSNYLGAENGLPGATGEKVARLKLLQANSMLFGFARPGEAARLFQEAAADSAADSTVVARSLYGAQLVYKKYLDKPDSAQIYITQLLENHPESPQAFNLQQQGDDTLLAYLMDLRENVQQTNYADLSDEELIALNTVDTIDFSSGDFSVASSSNFRRRMVYFSRRSNMLYEPTELAVNLQSHKNSGAEGSVVGVDAIPGGTVADAADLDENNPGTTTPTTASPASRFRTSSAGAGEAEIPKPEEPKEEEKKKGFDLR